MLHRILPFVLQYAGGLRFPTLAGATAVLFLIDLFLPDPIPLVDELLIGLVALMLANWKKTPKPPIGGSPR